MLKTKRKAKFFVVLFLGLSLWLVICQFNVLVQEPIESSVFVQLEEKVRRLEFEVQYHMKTKEIKVRHADLLF